MLGERFRNNEHIVPRESQRRVSEVVPATHESGIYGYPTPRNETWPADYWDTEDDDQVTMVHHSEFPTGFGQPVLRPAPQDPARPVTWQVGLFMESDALARLWIGNKGLTPDNAFVWSQHQQSWVSLLTVPEICASIKQARTELAGRRNTRELNAAIRRQTAKLSAILAHYSWSDFVARVSDLRARVRSLFFPVNFRRGRWVAAALLCLIVVAILLPRNMGSNQVTLAETQIVGRAQHEAKPDRTEATALESQDIIPVESLPLVPNSAKNQRRYGARPFDANLARFALDRAARQTSRCTRSEVSGTVLVGFEPSGSVNDVTLGTLNGDVTKADCILGVFRATRVAPFSGSRVVVKKSFRARSPTT